ncbi:MAG: hypothetical protein HQL36_06940 [Alphaproteobacteria bacterium]|nr:hypothetical protein [Alphaproteobacteria bacterium]
MSKETADTPMAQERRDIPGGLRRSIAYQLLKIVFSIYLTATIVITGMQMANEYGMAKGEVRGNLVTYQSIFFAQSGGRVVERRHRTDGSHPGRHHSVERHRRRACRRIQR